jgi:hypothetical protein
LEGRDEAENDGGAEAKARQGKHGGRGKAEARRGGDEAEAGDGKRWQQLAL